MRNRFLKLCVFGMGATEIVCQYIVESCLLEYNVIGIISKGMLMSSNKQLLTILKLIFSCHKTLK